MELQDRIGFWVSCGSFLVVVTGLMLVVCGLARAEPMVWSGKMPIVPPPEYSHPYEGKLTIHRVPLQEISQNCRNIPRVLGCAYWDRVALATCTVYIPSDMPAKATAAILAHELGHCNGWIHPNNDGRGLQPPLPVARDRSEAREAIVRRARENPVCQETPVPEECP